MSDDTDPPAEDMEEAPLPEVTGLENTMSPVDLPPIDEGAAPRPMLWTASIVAIATAFLLVFNASAIRSWAYGLTPGPNSVRVVRLAEGWYDTAASIGLTLPVETMSDGWDAVKATEFPTRAVAESTAADAPIEDGEVAEPAEDETEPGFSAL